MRTRVNTSERMWIRVRMKPRVRVSERIRMKGRVSEHEGNWKAKVRMKVKAS